MPYSSSRPSSHIDEYSFFKALLRHILERTNSSGGQLNINVAGLGSVKLTCNLPADFISKSNIITFGIEQSRLNIHKSGNVLEGLIERSDIDSCLPENSGIAKISGTLLLLGHVTPDTIDINLLNVDWTDCLKAFSDYSLNIGVAPSVYDSVSLVNFDAALSTSNKHDPITRIHQINVAKLSRWIGEAIGLEEQRLEALWISALLHDIGKLNIPRRILDKPGALDTSEYEHVKRHVDFSQPYLEELDALEKVKEIVSQHHEREDGSGYPKGLRSSQIYLEAKIIAVADVFDAMCASRPYRAPCRVSDVIAHLEESKGTLFDELVVDSLINLIPDTIEISRMYDDSKSLSLAEI